MTHADGAGIHQERPGRARPLPAPRRAGVVLAVLLAGVVVAGGNATGAAVEAGPVAANQVASHRLDPVEDTNELIRNFESPFLAVNPTNSDQVVVAYSVDTPDYNCYVGYSTDGGATWTPSVFLDEDGAPKQDIRPGWPDPPAGTCWRPAVAFGPEGDVYLATQNRPEGGGSQNIIVYASSDGGATFDPPVAIPNGTGFQAGITVDTHADSPHRGRIYAVWYYFPNFGQGIDLFLSHSDDGGQTWSDLTTTHAGVAGQEIGEDNQVFPTPVVAPDGTLYIGYKGTGKCPAGTGSLGFFPDTPQTCSIRVVRSSDGGDTFDLETEVAEARYEDLAAGEAPGIAVGPDGSVYMTWSSLPPAPDGNQEPHFDASCPRTLDVYVARSTDRGETWQLAEVPKSWGAVNDDDCQTGADQQNPWVSVAPDGRVDVIFYDRRNDPDNVLADVYYTSSTDGGVSFDPNRRLSDRSFDVRQMFTPFATQFQARNFDRQNAVASTPGYVLAAWGDARNTLEHSPDGDAGTTASDVFTTRLNRAGTPVRHLGRIGEHNRYATSVELSQSTFSFATTVTIASGESFPEGLAGAPLARKHRGPLVLTPPESLPAPTRQEIARLRPSQAYVLGGTDKVSTAVEDELRSLGVDEVVRIAGQDQYGTAARIADELNDVGVSQSATAVITSGEDPEEAIAAGAYAAYTRVPVLLVQHDSIPEATRQALQEHNVTTTVVVGGLASISEAVIEELASAGHGPERVAGADPYGTSTALAKRGLDLPVRPMPANVVYLASGLRWPGAVAAAPAVAYRGGTLLLADGDLTSGGFLRSHRTGIDQGVLIGCAAVTAVEGYAKAPAAAQGCPRLPGGVDDLQATALSSTELELTFSTPDDGTGAPASNYIIKQAPEAFDAAGFVSADSLCDPVCELDPPGTVGDPLTVTITGLTPKTTYHYALRAVNGERAGPISNVAQATTLSAQSDGSGTTASAPDEGQVLRRLAGHDRYSTAVAASQDSFPGGGATTVVLARGDDYADALAGAPLAVQGDGPLLLSLPETLHPRTEAELQRVLEPGGLVTLMGGPAAIGDAVAARVRELGYQTRRIAGPSRVETAIAAAQALGDPSLLLLATGYDFPDALTAAAAAAHNDGAVLLTRPDQRHPATDAYLQGQAQASLYAVGGFAARAYPEATPLFGPAREETAVAVADEFFPQASAVGIARRDDFPDAITGGAHIGRLGGPVLITPTNQLHPAPSSWLCSRADTLSTAYIYGGTAAIASSTADATRAAVTGAGC